MEVPIQVAVRIKPTTNVNDIICVHSIPFNNTIQVGNQHSFPVNYALPQDGSQSYIFLTTVSPLINCLLEGCDVSIVTLGQTDSGKTYTVLGPGLHCAFSESEHGIIPRFIREIFCRLSAQHERNITISITWTQICGENIQDLLGNGSVEVNNVSDAFHWLQLGISNMAPSNAHTLFTLTVEQQYIIDSLIEHKISTASFSDLSSCEKVVILDNLGEPRSIPIDNGLLTLHNVIATLTDTYYNNSLNYQLPTYVPYNQSTLTTLLKDSFGGRAKTLVICCLSPLLRDFSETLYTLQMSVKVQCIRNYVTTNSYTNNTIENIENFDTKSDNNEVQNESINRNSCQDMFGLHFAITQWTKLVSNAENLFNKLITTKQLSDCEIDQISEWLLLKAECEECLSSEETISIDNLEPQRSLGRIEEENELDNDTTLTETDADESESNEVTSESEEFESEETECSDLDQQKPDFFDKLDSYMQKFKQDTDSLLTEMYEKDLIEESDHKNSNSNLQHHEESNCVKHLLNKSVSPNEQLKAKGARGRRASIHPGNSISLIPDIISGNVTELPEMFTGIDIISASADFEKLNIQALVPVPQSTEILPDCKELAKYSTDPIKQLKNLAASTEAKQKKIRQIIADLESGQKQIHELEYTIQIKESLIASMIKNDDTRTYAKQKFHKKRSKLQQEYYKARTQLAQAENNLLQCHTINKLELKDEIEKLKNVAQFYEKRLKDLESIRIITEDSARKVLELQNSLHTSKKQLERLKKSLRKEEKQKECLEQELLEHKMKISELESQKLQQESVNNKICTEEKSSDLENIDEKETRTEVQNIKRKKNPLQQSSKTNSISPEQKTNKNLKEINDKIVQMDHLINEKSTELDSIINLEEKETIRLEILKLRRARDYLETKTKNCKSSDGLETYNSKEIEESSLIQDEKDNLRHEIRNLRRTRDYLLEQRCLLDMKYKKDKTLSETEERKLLEFEEAISAIDCAIEYKNELICGRKLQMIPHDATNNQQPEREKGEELLMQRLLKLSEDEMRTLLYKYFNRVIDLRESSKKLELQNIQLEGECESNIWRIQTLSHLLQQVRLETERRVVLLQQQHEEKMNLLMRHFCDETSASSDRSDFDNPNKVDKIMTKILERNAGQQNHQICQIAGTSRQTAYSEQPVTLKYKQGNRLLDHPVALKCKQDIDQHERRVITKYSEENTRDKNKLIAKFQELTRYHSEKRRVNTVIPSQNLRHLQSTSDAPSTKVTRQKNKLIIQQSKTKK